MNASTYWKKAQDEIPNERTSSIKTQDIIKHSLSDDLICEITLLYQLRKYGYIQKNICQKTRDMVHVLALLTI